MMCSGHHETVSNLFLNAVNGPVVRRCASTSSKMSKPVYKSVPYSSLNAIISISHHKKNSLHRFNSSERFHSRPDIHRSSNLHRCLLLNIAKPIYLIPPR